MAQPTVKSLKKENEQLKIMIEALTSDFKRLEAGLESHESAIAKSKETHSSPDAETVKSLEFMSNEYDELNNFRATAKQTFSALNTRLSELTENVDKISNAICDLEQYSYSYNVKLIGIPESGRKESAIETSTVCANLFKEIGADITIQDIDIAHRVPTRKRSSPRPIICMQVHEAYRQRKVMEKRRDICKVSMTKIGLSGNSLLTEARILDHLTPKNQQLLSDTKVFQTTYGYRFCWTKNGIVFLRKTENSRPIKVNDQSVLQVLSQNQNDE
jgi:hypothetical protein